MREITKEDIEYARKILQDVKVPGLDPNYGALVWSISREDYVYPVDLTDADREWWASRLERDSEAE